MPPAAAFAAIQAASASVSAPASAAATIAAPSPQETPKTTAPRSGAGAARGAPASAPPTGPSSNAGLVEVAAVAGAQAHVSAEIVEAEPADPEASASAPEAPDPSSAATPGAAPSADFAPDAPAPAPALTPTDTVAAFAAQVARRLDQRASRFDITLDPAGLGRVAVAMEIGGDGALTARLAFERADAAHLVGAHADDLHRALADAGFRLAPDAIRFDVAAQPASMAAPAGQGSNPGLASGFGGSGGFEGRDGTAAGRTSPGFIADDDLASVAFSPSRAAAGGLDIRI